MIWNNIISYYVILLLLPAISLAGNVQPILDHIKPNTITIIGETHKRKESIHLFQELITGSLEQNKCLVVGLEIASNQQSIIDRIVQGRAVASALTIAPMIDHPPFRKMVDDLAALQQNGTCLKLVAIDAGNDIDMRRDEWMAVKLAEQWAATPILVLLGRLHTLKRVDWDLSMTKPSPYVAEILSAQGYRVSTYPQAWPDNDCTNEKHSRYQFIPADKPEAVKLLNDSLISLINAFPVKTAKGIVDGLIVWPCKAR